MPIFLLILGILLLLISTNLLVKTATRISLALRLSPLIIGLTIVAIGTSLPELVVSAVATYRGDAGLALGNIIGSNIINVLLVLALGIIIGKVKVGKVKTQRNILFLLGISFLFPILFGLSVPPVIIGILLLTLSVVFTYIEYQWGIQGRGLEDKVLLKVSPKVRFQSKDLLMIMLSLGMIFLGGTLVVESVKQLAQVTGYSTTIFGLSLTAIATSLPELLTTIISRQQKQDKLMLGNILGSNVYNVLLIGGVTSLGLQNFSIPVFDILIFLVTTIIFTGVVFIYKGKYIPRFIGISFLILCIIYFISLYRPTI